MRGFPFANHIIRQDEDKAKLLLYAISIADSALLTTDITGRFLPEERNELT